MNGKIRTFSVLLLMGLFLAFLSSEAFARGPIQRQSFAKTTGTPIQTLSNIGNWAYWILADGTSANDPFTGDSGGIYPRGTAGAIFTDGLVWGGFVRDGKDPALRVGGTTYRTGLKPGWVENGQPADPNADDVRVYRIRSDWRTLTAGLVARDAAELNAVNLSEVTEAMINAVIDQYATDWKEWPVEHGAPFVDVNNNGVYDPILDADGFPDETQGDYPGIANADQVIWFAMNDFDESQAAFVYGSPSMHLEVQVTTWAYNQPGAKLGQLIFKQYTFINHGAQIDSMFVAQWSDPDLGDYGDDVVGCDSVLSIGFVYNGGPVDAAYDAFGLPPASAGYDFFQGPIVFTGNDADTAVFNLQKRIGWKNLPMTSFSWFAAGSDISDPRLGDYEDGTKPWYNMLNGFIPTNDLNNPTPYVHGSGPAAGRPTKFPLNGDPVNDPDGINSDVDGKGNNLGPSDRRMVLSSGPFDMAPGDTQQVVVAVIGALGADYLGSVRELKETDVVAQKLYDDLFATVPKAPPAPQVNVYPFGESSIVLEWGSNPDAVAATEADNPLTGYNFEGYNVYQLPSPTAGKDEAVRVATFDKVNGVTTIKGKRLVPQTGLQEEITVQFGGDFGVQRHIVIDRNFLTGEPLYPGNTYYFAVTAYNYNPTPDVIEDKALESSIIPIQVVPQPPKPGERFADIGTTLDLSSGVEHTAGASDGQVQVTVIDPAAVTGHTYEVFFTEDTTTGELFWNVRDVTSGEVKVSGQPQAVTLTERNDQPIFDGIQVKVTGPKFDFKSFQVVANANGPLDPPEGGALDFDGFPSLRPSDAQQATGDGHWAIHTADNGSRCFYGDPDDPTGDNFLGRTTRNGANWPEIIPWDFEWRFVGTTSWSWDVFVSGNFYEVPFELWNIGINTPDDPSDDYRMVPIILDADENGVFALQDSSDHCGSSADNDPFTDWVYWYNPTGHSSEEPPGTAGYDAAADSMAAGTYTGYHVVEVMARMVLVNWNGGSAPPYNQDLPEDGTIFRIVTNKPNTVEDVFSFTTPAPVFSQSAAKEDIEKINVFPNPYYAFNPQETSRFERFVTFSHLPKKVTIRIFNLAGVLVRTLTEEDKASPDDQYLRWDLKNEADLPVASGIYFAHIDMPELGATKVLKVFIIQRQEILEFF